MSSPSSCSMLGFLLLGHFAPEHDGVSDPLPEHGAALVWLNTDDGVS